MQGPFNVILGIGWVLSVIVFAICFDEQDNRVEKMSSKLIKWEVVADSYMKERGEAPKRFEELKEEFGKLEDRIYRLESIELAEKEMEGEVGN